MDSPTRRNAASKRATNVSLNAELIAEARMLDVNVSEACERGLTEQVKKAREAKWLDDNLSALEAWNEWVRENGIPYAEYRQP